MKLLSLNTWGASCGQELFDYLSLQAKDTDIFCFQEVFNSEEDLADRPEINGNMNSLAALRQLLPNHEGYFAVSSRGHDLAKHIAHNVEEGVAIFVKKGLPVVSVDSWPIFTSPAEHVDPSIEDPSRSLQRVSLQVGERVLHVFNYHGIAYPGTKVDTAERLEQSAKILARLNEASGPKILSGDFNLMPDTESVKAFERAGLKNLIKEYKIQNTRNEVSWKSHNNKQYFADFAFVSPEIKVQNFEVPYTLVSDHLPLIITFSV